MLAHEVFDSKNTLPHVNIVIYRFIYMYYVFVNICCDYPLPVCFSTAKPEWLWWIM